MSGQLDVTDSADLTYLSSQERDDLLQQILNLWISALGSAHTGGLKIRFISESSSASGGRTVTYAISGSTATRSASISQLTSTVHQSFGGLRAKLSGSFGGGSKTVQISGSSSWTVTGGGSMSGSLSGGNQGCWDAGLGCWDAGMLGC
ncbi:hypothetical protein BV898_18599 [Hypsibius exemplaris]|uniref:Uncharacterized protein n=1 Tax=Hypsibius exemplaris TaxID=2072580 RepID=A0A9X6RNM4_HYPEX|nr:hypothetical protein BV898_18599 [Hypsibius exemplaris]